MLGYSLEKLEKELLKDTLDLSKLEKFTNSKGFKINVVAEEKTKSTLLHIMIKKNKYDSIEWLLSHHANPYVEDNKDTPAFFYIIDSNNPKKMLEIYAKHNLDLDYKNSHGRSLIQDIVLLGEDKLLNLLLPRLKRAYSQDKYGKNILFDAMSNGSRDIIERVFMHKDKNKDLNVITTNNENLLLVFKDIEDLKKLEFLLKVGVSPSIQDNEGKNIINYLCEKIEASTTDLEINKLGELIKIALSYQGVIDQKDKEGNTLLNSFIKSLTKPLGEYQQKQTLSDLITKFVECGIDINEKNNDDETPLLMGIEKNDLEATTLLIENGADIDRKDKNGRTPLVLAILKLDKAYEPIIQLLINSNANTNIKDKNSMNIVEMIVYLMITINDKNQELIPNSFEEVLNSLNLSDKASLKGYIQDLLLLILSSNNFDISNLDSNGNPTFYIAIISGNDLAAIALFKKGAKISQVNKEKQNLLSFYLQKAVESNIDKSEIEKRVKKIVGYGFNLEQKDENGATLIHNAIINYPITICKILVNLHANTNSCDNKDRNILHSAIWTKDIEKVKFVLNANKELINKVDCYGVLPINYAVFLGCKEIVCFLISKGSFVNNTFEKKESIVNYLKRFYNNILALEKMEGIPQKEQNDLKILLNNMRKEFNIID